MCVLKSKLNLRSRDGLDKLVWSKGGMDLEYHFWDPKNNRVEKDYNKTV